MGTIMARGEARKRAQKIKRWEGEEKAFNRDLNALLLKHKAKIVARSHGGAYCSSDVSLVVHIGDQSFEIGEDNLNGDLITVNGTEPPVTEE